MAEPLDKLASTQGRDLFLPLGFRLSLRLEQVTWAEVVEDPGLASFTLRSGLRLLGADGLVNWFDPWFEAESAGVSVQRDELGGGTASGSFLTAPPSPEAVLDAPGVSRVLDVTRRLCAETGSGAAVLGYLTGGATLLANILGDDVAAALLARSDDGSATPADGALLDAAARISVAIGDAYCAAGVSGLLMCEERDPRGGAYLTAFAPLFNLADYYGVPVVFLARGGADARQAGVLGAQGVKRIVVAGGLEGDMRCVDDEVVAGAADAGPWLASQPGAPGTRVFLTGWDLPADTRPEAVAGVSKTIKA